MPGNSNTSLTIEAKTKGLNSAQAAMERLGKKGAEATKAAKEEVSRLESQLRKLTVQQTKLNRALDDTEKGSKAYKKLSAELRNVERDSGRVEKNVRSLERAYRDTAKAAKAGAFSQGFLQGAVPSAAFIQRGPGAFRQAAGVGVGRAARGVAGGMSQIPFQGAGGIAQALQSIPGGGMLAAPLMMGMQRASQALQYRQQKQELAPFLNMGGRAGGQVGTGETSAQQRTRAMTQASSDMAKERANRGKLKVHGGGLTALTSMAVQGAGNLLGGLAERFPDISRQINIDAAGGEAAYNTQQDLREQNKRADAIVAQEGVRKRRMRHRTLGDVIRKQGARFGFASPEAMQIMGGITQAGGGTGGDLVSQGMVQMGLAGKRMGMGPEVSGAFLQGGRRGGVVGGQGRAGGAMEDAIKEGMAMGLQGSELNDWMQQMAGDIRGWRSSGIPINTSSISAIGTSLAASGIGGLRGSVMARGFAKRAQELSTRGPQTAAELVMFQELGGFKGGGVEDLEEAQLKMQEGKFGAADIKKVASRFLGAGGGGAGGRAVFRRALGSMGINVGIRESRLLEKQVRGGTLDEGERKALAAAQSEREAGATAAEAFSPGAVAGGIDSALKRQANLVNQQIASGQSMITAMQDLEATTGNVVKGFTTLVSGPLTKLTNGIAGLSDEIPGLTEKLRAMVSGDWVSMVSGGGG